MARSGHAEIRTTPTEGLSKNKRRKERKRLLAAGLAKPAVVPLQPSQRSLDRPELPHSYAPATHGASQEKSKFNALQKGAWQQRVPPVALARRSIPARPTQRLVPSPAYLAVVASRSAPRAPLSEKPPPIQLVVLDLNGTLLARSWRNVEGANQAVLRPYVSALLEYLLGTDIIGLGRLRPRFSVMVRTADLGSSV